MKELKVGDIVHSRYYGAGEVVGILTSTPPNYFGPVVIKADNALLHRDIYGAAAGPANGCSFSKVTRKEKVTVYLNIYKRADGGVNAYAHSTISDANKFLQHDRDTIGKAVPFEYEYEVED